MCGQKAKLGKLDSNERNGRPHLEAESTTKTTWVNVSIWQSFLWQKPKQDRYMKI